MTMPPQRLASASPCFTGVTSSFSARRNSAGADTIGAIGAVVLADTRRLADCFPSVDYFERRGTPFIVAVNCFEGACWYEPDEVRLALDLDPHVPLLLCDARQRESGKQALIALVEHVLRILANRREAVEV